MTVHNRLTGQLLISQPKNQDRHFTKSVILVAQHNETGAWGVVVNKQARTVSLKDIMNAVGIDYSGDEVAYVGGPVEPTRVHVVHSLDWSSPGTLKISDDLGITGDITILTAISRGEGPRSFRAGVGLAVWSAGQLDGEQTGTTPWTPEHVWLTAPATSDLCLTGASDEQWQNAIEASVKQKISEFF